MFFDCSLFKDKLKQEIMEEISKKLDIPVQEINLAYLSFDLISDTLNLSELEKRALIKALSRTSGNISKTAKLLGVSRKTIYQLIKKYHIVTFININDY